MNDIGYELHSQAIEVLKCLHKEKLPYHQVKKQLNKNMKSRKTPVRLVERSKIVLLAAEGTLNKK